MLKLIIVLSLIILFFVVKWLAFLIVQNVKLPVYIDYKPYNCPTCLSFWLNLGLSVCLTLIITKLSVIYIIITLLDGVALLIDYRNFKSLNEL